MSDKPPELSDVPFSLFAAISAGTVLLYFYFHNKDRRIERYYIRNHKNIYVALQAAYFVLIMSVVLNFRFVMSLFLGPLQKIAKKQIMSLIKVGPKH